MKIHLLFLLLLSVATGCAKIPFAAPAKPKLVNSDARAIRDNFASRTPTQFTSEDTVIISAPLNKLAALGMLRVDRDAGTFDLICMNHIGVQLFFLSGDRESTSIKFAVPPLLEQKTVLDAIAQDIRNIYLDVVPSPQAKSSVHRNFVLYRDGRNEVDYEFGGPDTLLLEKRHGNDIWPIWRVRYYEYAATPEGLFPKGMVLDNHRYHYRIIIKNRSWQVGPGGQ